MAVSLTEAISINTDIETYLNRVGEIFKAYRDQDSACVSYGLFASGSRWFIKHSSDPRGIESLRRARHLHASVHHPALPHLWNDFDTSGGLALVYDWLPGEVLYQYSVAKGEMSRRTLSSPHARFRALPLGRILDALDTIFDVHLSLSELGFIAVDFYDGCILYDFDTHQTYLVDLDEYRPGPFILEADRLPGSRRFMAPEEWQRGALIDGITNVYTLGRTALVLLSSGSGRSENWRGTERMRVVADRAASPERKARYSSVREFVKEWRLAVAGSPFGEEG
jgi:serine/threonine-protein kinase